MSLLRWAAVTVPAILLLGIGAGRLSGSGDGNAWFDALVKPDIMPPGWAFPVAWTTLYILIGLAFAMILNARRARYRGIAIALFLAQMALNLSWSPLFFAAHQIWMALAVIVAMLLLSIATTIMFGRIRTAAAWLMVPYLAWLSFAAILNYQYGVLNPDASTLVPEPAKTQIML
jgi:benzodiazapine receptor